MAPVLRARLINKKKTYRLHMIDFFGVEDIEVWEAASYELLAASCKRFHAVFFTGAHSVFYIDKRGANELFHLLSIFLFQKSHSYFFS
jgi:hypothetical protein